MRIRPKHTGLVFSWAIRAICRTLWMEITDRAGVLSTGLKAPVICAFWHNRIFMLPWIYTRLSRNIPCVILSSPSRDGQVITDICEQFGLEIVRGSSSKPEKGMNALIELVAKVRNGYSVGITPDGPRGPCYHLNPGVLKLAQVTGASILPVHIRFERYWQFNTWDRFMLPKPFSCVDITLDDLVTVPRHMDEADFEQKRQSLEDIMRKGAEA